MAVKIRLAALMIPTTGLLPLIAVIPAMVGSLNKLDITTQKPI